MKKKEKDEEVFLIAHHVFQGMYVHISGSTGLILAILVSTNNKQYGDIFPDECQISIGESFREN